MTPGSYKKKWALTLGPAALMVTAAFAAFYATAPGGFLSDDFGLLDSVVHKSVWQLFQLPITTAAEPKFYRPLSLLMFWKLNHSLFGMNPAGYWAASVLMHAVNGFLLYLIIKRLSGSVLAAVAGGLIFVLIPLHGESVAWLCCAFDRFCLFFILIGVLGYVAYRAERKMPFYILSLASFVFALLSKEMALTFPALIVLAEILYWEKGGRIKEAALRVLPFCIIFGVYLLLRFMMFKGIGGYPDAQGASRDLAFNAETVFPTLKSLPAYILFPANRLLFKMPPVYWFLGSIYLLVFAVSAIASLDSLKLKIFILGLAWMAFTLVAVINILPLFPQLMRGRLIYTPLAGFAIFASAFFMPSAKSGKAIAITEISLLVLLLSGYLFIDSINYKAWKKAYAIDSSILNQTNNLCPSFPAGSKLYYIGIPDNYNGAFLFRNGLDNALNLFYGYEGGRRVLAGIVNEDGTLPDDPARNYEDAAAREKNVYVFYYSGQTEALGRVFPQKTL